MLSENLLRFRWLGTKLPSSSSRRLVILTGARQTGKTTLARKIYPQLNYINLDAPENRDAMREISTFRWAQTVGEAIIDEAQKEPTVFEKVKYSYDAGSIGFCILLGSSQIILLRKIRESLAGRAFVYELWPLMVAEILHADNEAPVKPLISNMIETADVEVCMRDEPEVLFGDGDDRRRQIEQHLLTWGGMPELLSLPEDDRDR